MAIPGGEHSIKMFLRKILICLLTVAPLVTFDAYRTIASDKIDHSSYIKYLIKQAEQKNLANNSYWKILLHYHGTRSAIKDRAFFVAPNGDVDPKAELIATLKAFFDVSHLDDSHAICRFPARLKWLTNNLGIDNSLLPKPSCIKLQKFLYYTAITSASLCFASESFKHPDSLMGHLFLKLDGKNDKQKTSHALSYFAVLTPNTAPSFFYKALFSGVKGCYLLTPYQTKLNEYNNKERRNVWELRLSLNKEQLDDLALHIFEMKGINVKYNFINNNCGGAVMDVLYAANPDFRKNYKLFDTPLNIASKLIRSGYVDNASLYPVIDYKMRMLLDDLTSQEIVAVKKILKDKNLNAAEQLDSSNQKNRVILAASAALGLQLSNKPKPLPEYESLMKSIERKKSYTNDNVILINHANKLKNPFNSNSTSCIALGYLKEDGIGAVDFNFYPAYSSLASDHSEYFSEFELQLLNIRVNYYSDKQRLRIRELDLVRVKNIIPYKEFVGGISGEFKLGLEQEDNNPKADRLFPNILFGVGYAKSYLPEDTVLIYALMRLGDAYYSSKNIVYASPEIGFFVRYYFGKIQLNYDHYFSSDKYKYKNALELSNTFYIKRNHDFQIVYTKSKNDDNIITDTILAIYNYYF